MTHNTKKKTQMITKGTKLLQTSNGEDDNVTTKLHSI